MPEKITTIFLLRNGKNLLGHWAYASFEKAKEAYLDYIADHITPEERMRIGAMTEKEFFEEQCSFAICVDGTPIACITEERLIY